jgi:ribose/xylose/arabinose/galactoside ABC-type transport system permease subunit
MAETITSSVKPARVRVHPFLRQSGVFWVLVLLCLTAAFISPYFLQYNNIINVIRQISIVGVISIGMTFVILTSGIDLSVGSIVGLVAVIVASILAAGGSPRLAVPAGLLLGTVLGALNGLGIAFGRIPPFIMTLGSMVGLRGLAMIYANGSPVSWESTHTDFSWLGTGSVLRVPVSVWLFIAVFLVAGFVLRYTSFGRHIYAIGDSREAARLSGINVRRVEIGAYTIMGFLSALAAVLFVSRLDVGEPTAGTGAELDAIAMVVIGGTSTFGGEGGVKGTLVGAAIIAVLANLLNLLGISPFIQQLVKGVIIVFAVLIERQRQRRGTAKSA